jgi:transcriptional regulator with GAF, ATPase, and Fis domain
VAQTIHRLSPRAHNTMMVFDCGAVPKNLIESELFGHEKGSFTGAIMTRQGLFEMAHGSTLFLDELGELPSELQPKLLRSLEQREIRRVGATRSLKVDVRIIAATNRQLEEEVRSGRFRQDLFYRLSVVRLYLPPLRERIDDIPLLVETFLLDHAYNRLPDGTRKVTRVSGEAMDLLLSYSWPGNVRELINAVERAVSFAVNGTIRPDNLPDSLRGGEAVRDRSGPNSSNNGERVSRGRSSGAHATSESPRGSAADSGVRTSLAASSGTAGAPPPTPQTDVPFKDAKEQWVAAFEREYIVALLRKNRGNISHASREAEIDRKYFRKLMRKYDIEGHRDEPLDEEE